MQAILNAFWQIVLFRSGPQSLSDSRPLLFLAGLLYVTANILFVVSRYPPQSLVAVAVDLLLLCGWCAGLLVFFGFRNRLPQTLTAMFGVGAVLQLITIPVLFLPALGLPLAVMMLALVFILLWSTAVHGYILAQALEKSFGIGVALAVVYFLLSNGIVGPLLMPENTDPAWTD